METEIWKNTEDINYQISSLGRLKTIDRYLPNNTPYGIGKFRLFKGKLKKLCAASHGYLTASIGSQNHLIHRLVAKAFLENPKGYKYVDHINRNKLDNRVCNLRWCSMSQNLMNVGRRKNSKNKYRGVSLMKSRNKWRVRIGKKQYGIFKTENEAYNKWKSIIKQFDI